MSQAGGLPADVERFLARHVSSLEQLEVLLFLHGHGGAPLSVAEIASQLRKPPASVAQCLTRLGRRGLVLASPGEPARHALDQAHPDAALLPAVAEVFRSRPVSVITFIFSQPLEEVRAFAEAFDLKKRS